MIPDFIRRVQRAGWLLVTVQPESCVARCSRPGCDMQAKFVPNRPIPCVGQDDRSAGLMGFEALRQTLRRRRHELALTIPEVEAAAGLAADHLAKSEREGSTRPPNFDLCVQWAAALGYELTLRPAALPPITTRLIADSRHLFASRRKAQARAHSEGKP